MTTRLRALHRGLVFMVVLTGCATTPATPASDPAPAATPSADPPPATAAATPSPQPAATAPEASPSSAGPKVTPPLTVQTITGIPICDAYLDLYARCENHLRPEIMAGDRRFYAAEKASLQHFAGSPEAATLPASCSSMLDALEIDCPAPQRAAAGAR